MKKSFLYVIQSASFDGVRMQEALDEIMTVAAFDQPVSLLFLDEGVYSLKRGQNPGVLKLKDVAPIFDALAMYEIQQLLIEDESLKIRGLSYGDLILSVKLVSRSEIGGLLDKFDVILTG